MRNMQSDCAMNSKDGLTMVKTRLREVLEGRAVMYKIIMLDYSVDEMQGPEIASAIRNLLSNCIEQNPEYLDLKLQLNPYICCCTSFDKE